MAARIMAAVFLTNGQVSLKGKYLFTQERMFYTMNENRIKAKVVFQ
jgi:hypothetical protein